MPCLMLFMLLFAASSSAMDVKKTEEVTFSSVDTGMLSNDQEEVKAINVAEKSTDIYVLQYAAVSLKSTENTKKTSATEAEVAAVNYAGAEVGYASDVAGIVVNSDILFYLVNVRSANISAAAVHKSSNLLTSQESEAQPAVIAKWVEGSGFFFEDENGNTAANEVHITI